MHCGKAQQAILIPSAVHGSISNRTKGRAAVGELGDGGRGRRSGCALITSDRNLVGRIELLEGSISRTSTTVCEACSVSTIFARLEHLDIDESTPQLVMLS
jgi:hypothetical protein